MYTNVHPFCNIHHPSEKSRNIPMAASKCGTHTGTVCGKEQLMDKIDTEIRFADMAEERLRREDR